MEETTVPSIQFFWCDARKILSFINRGFYWFMGLKITISNHVYNDNMRFLQQSKVIPPGARHHLLCCLATFVGEGR